MVPKWTTTQERYQEIVIVEGFMEMYWLQLAVVKNNQKHGTFSRKLRNEKKSKQCHKINFVCKYCSFLEKYIQLWSSRSRQDKWEKATANGWGSEALIYIQKET